MDGFVARSRSASVRRVRSSVTGGWRRLARWRGVDEDRDLFFRTAVPAGAGLAFDVALLALTIRGVFGRADRVVLFRVLAPDFPPTATFLI